MCTCTVSAQKQQTIAIFIKSQPVDERKRVDEIYNIPFFLLPPAIRRCILPSTTRILIIGILCKATHNELNANK